MDSYPFLHMSDIHTYTLMFVWSYLWSLQYSIKDK